MESVCRVAVVDVWSRPEVGGPDDRETQLVRGEPVQVTAAEGPQPAGWLRVVCPSQPSSKDPRGYPGWVRATALTEGPPRGAGGPSLVGSVGSTADAGAPLLAAARAYLGTPYLWGGMTRRGIDCSGLVHQAARSIGLLVPRDAHDQAAAVHGIPLEQARSGDLCFFARPGAPIHHVGIVTAPGHLLHAPQSGAVVREEPLSGERLATFVAAARPAYSPG